MIEITTVADDEVVLHDGPVARRHGGLAPDTDYVLDGVGVRTLPRPPGEHLATVATVNDVHIGERECGRMEGVDLGPVLTSDPGAPPYPELMSAAAIDEMRAVGPHAVVVKGDLTAAGTDDEYRRFLDLYEGAFGSRLLHVRGNHDAEHGGTYAAWPVQCRDVPGARLAVLDTSRADAPSGRLDTDQLDWLDTVAAESDRPVLVFGHHHPWAPGSATREPGYFGLDPDSSERLVDVVARRRTVIGYFAGHTHRNRVRRFAATGDVPWVEVASTKDFPGCWAEYRIFEGGVLQVQRRISSSAALAWTERTRAMFAGLYPQYSFGRLEDRCFAIGLRA